MSLLTLVLWSTASAFGQSSSTPSIPTTVFNQRMGKRGANPFAGTWVMNRAKSTTTDSLPKALTLVYASTRKGEKSTATGTRADGSAIKTEYRADYDGKDHPVTGSPTWDTIALTRKGDTVTAVMKKAGKVVSKSTRQANDDTLTITGTATNAQGKEFNFKYVFDYQ